MQKQILKLIFVLMVFLMLPSFASAAVFLDGSTIGCNNGSTNYAPITRSCGSGNDTVYLDLANFNTGIVPSVTNYVRSGNYFRDGVPGSLVVAVSKSGIDNNNRTVISAYPGEERQVIIGTATRGATYNSNPGDTVSPYGGSQTYYPNTVLAISGASYVTINGLKIYGQTYTWGGHDVTLQNSDFGGGGPSELQGNVVKLHGGDTGGQNLIVRNNGIHNSCWGENDENGSAIIMYNASALIEGNIFYDNWGYDIFTKDSGNQAGQTTEIKNNFFAPSAIFPAVGGIRGHNQDVQIDSLLIHHNIFLQKQTAFAVLATPVINRIYNNTFINSAYDIGNSSSGGPHPIESYNNLFYHATNQYFAELYMDTGTVYTDYFAGSNWNVFYNNGSKWGKSAPGALTWETTLSGWQTRTGLDGSSIMANPNFVNAAGTVPTDFKRSAYIENFAGSMYGTHAGAYEVGDEQIGIDWSIQADDIAPAAPSGLGVL
ncbi:MAG: hypothetical protein HGA36_03100 [Candidatus Moranbacteria bacterium]|nr:hypothetical protein [Candidatus Moranbacteria bacterium]